MSGRLLSVQLRLSECCLMCVESSKQVRCVCVCDVVGNVCLISAESLKKVTAADTLLWSQTDVSPGVCACERDLMTSCVFSTSVLNHSICDQSASKASGCSCCHWGYSSNTHTRKTLTHRQKVNCGKSGEFYCVLTESKVIQIQRGNQTSLDFLLWWDKASSLCAKLGWTCPGPAVSLYYGCKYIIQIWTDNALSQTLLEPVGLLQWCRFIIIRFRFDFQY